jgi:SapC
MTRLIPVREIAHLRLALPQQHDRWVEQMTWIPASPTEIHLASRFYPIAIRLEDQEPRLGLLVGQRYLAHALLNSAGKWRGAYRPVGLRCFPFQAPDIGDNPLSDILIDADSEYLSPTSGALLVDGTLQPSRMLTELHRLFSLLKHGQQSLAGVLDQYLVGGLLVPLTDGDTPVVDRGHPLYIINPARFAHIESAGLAAMARRGFLSVDVAIACQFSLQNLRPEYRPKDAGHYGRRGNEPAMLAMDTTMIDDLSLVLDDGELISVADIDVMRAGGVGVHPGGTNG